MKGEEAINKFLYINESAIAKSLDQSSKIRNKKKRIR